MIISASRRTDIPCYYSKWMLNRLKEGVVSVRNPYNSTQVSELWISPENVDCIVFWTKDATNIMDKLEAIDLLGYKYCFQYTITPYGPDIELNLQSKKNIINNFCDLSRRIGPDKIIWRYDPILINEKYDFEFHKKAFSRMCDVLSQHTRKVIISFVDIYKKTRKIGAFNIMSYDDIKNIAKCLSEIARKKGLKIQTCCEEINLMNVGIEGGGCIDKELIESTCGKMLKLKRAPGQRKLCKCVDSIDIGAYNSCLNGCIYCYANTSFEFAKRNYFMHDPTSRLLIGKTTASDKIIVKCQGR